MIGANSNISKFFIGFLIVVVIALLQNPHYHLFGAMYAEESVVFYSRINSTAKDVLLGLDCGYYPLLKNIILYIGHFIFKLTPYVFPYFLHIAMLFLIAVCYFLFWTNHFSKLIRSDLVRFLICLCLLFSTFLPDCGTFLNFDYVYFWYLFWVVLYLTSVDKDKMVTYKDLPYFLWLTPLFCIGKPHLLCFFPVFFYLIFLLRNSAYKFVVATMLIALIVSAIIIKLNFPVDYQQSQSLTFFDKLYLLFQLFFLLPGKFVFENVSVLASCLSSIIIYISIALLFFTRINCKSLIVCIVTLYISYLVIFSFKITPFALLDLDHVVKNEPTVLFRYNLFLLNCILLFCFLSWLFFKSIVKFSLLKKFVTVFFIVVVSLFQFANWNLGYKEENGLDWIDRVSDLSHEGVDYEYVPSYIRAHLPNQTYLDVYTKNAHLAYSGFLDLNQFIFPKFDNIMNGTFNYELEIDQDYENVLSLTLIGRVVGNYNHSNLSCSLVDNSQNEPQMILIGAKNILGRKPFTLTLDHIFSGKQVIKKGLYNLVCSSPMLFIKKKESLNSVGYNVIVAD